MPFFYQAFNNCEYIIIRTHKTIALNCVINGGVEEAICQNIKTGNIETFLPDQLRVLGLNIKE